jgi:hypothetical protein
VIFILIVVSLSEAAGDSSPTRQDLTSQQQTIGASVNRVFTQTEQAKQEIVMTQTVEAAFEQALTSTFQAGPISEVNGHQITTEDFQSRVRFLRWLTAEQIRDLYYLTGGNMDYIQQLAGQQISNLRYPTLMGGEVLGDMEEEIILEQAAQERGITIDEAAVEREINEYMASRVGLVSPDANTPTPTLTPTITATPLVSPIPTTTLLPTPTLALIPTATLEPDMIWATLGAEESHFYDQAADWADVDRSVIWDVFYYQALRMAMMDAIGKDVPTEELQVNARHILISFNPDLPLSPPPPPTDEQRAAAKARADEVLAALQHGESFADLAREFSDDAGNKYEGGELGWANPDVYVPEFGDALLNAEIGQIVGPIESRYGYHIIQVHAREIRQLSPSELYSRRCQAYQEWLNTEKSEAKINRRPDWLNYVPDSPTYEELLGDILPY